MVLVLIINFCNFQTKNLSSSLITRKSKPVIRKPDNVKIELVFHDAIDCDYKYLK